MQHLCAKFIRLFDGFEKSVEVLVCSSAESVCGALLDVRFIFPDSRLVSLSRHSDRRLDDLCFFSAESVPDGGSFKSVLWGDEPLIFALVGSPFLAPSSAGPGEFVLKSIPLPTNSGDRGLEDSSI